MLKNDPFLDELRIMLENDLLLFTQFFFRENKKKRFITNSHHKKMTIEYYNIFNYILEFLNINIPPRFTKTTIAVNAVAQGIAKNSLANFMYITGSDQLRIAVSTEIRDIINSPYYQLLWGVKFKNDRNTKELWVTDVGGSLTTATIFSNQILGFGAGIMRTKEDRADDFDGCIILDDINKIDDVENQSKKNERANDIIVNTILSRKNTEDTPIINIQQRAGLNDATAKFEEIFPASDTRKYLIMPAKNAKGKALWPFKLSIKKLDELENNPETSHIFDTQYMQDPVSKHGLLFPKKELRQFNYSEIKEKLSESTIRLNYTDTADKGKDYFSSPFGYVYEGLVYITDAIYNQLDLLANDMILAEASINHNITNGVIESNKEGSYFYGNVNKLIKKKQTELNISERSIFIGKSVHTNKEARINVFAAFIKKYFVFRNDYKPGSDYDLMMRHLTVYLKGVKNQKDDGADSLAGLCSYCRFLKIF